MMSDDKYDALFEETAPDDSVFVDKRALDPLAEPEEVVARDAQERQLARLLNGVQEGYLPTTVSIYGPPGTGTTLPTRRSCRLFAATSSYQATRRPRTNTRTAMRNTPVSASRLAIHPIPRVSPLVRRHRTRGS